MSATPVKPGAVWRPMGIRKSLPPNLTENCTGCSGRTKSVVGCMACCRYAWACPSGRQTMWTGKGKC